VIQSCLIKFINYQKKRIEDKEISEGTLVNYMKAIKLFYSMNDIIINWKLVTDKGKVTNFTSEFYTGPTNGANNHTHQVTNLRVQDDRHIQLSTDGSTQISGLTDVKTNGKSAWNDVPTTISISNGRTISINVADNGTQRHFMGQPIYGIVKDLKTQQ
jgi:hypothetical protein